MMNEYNKQNYYFKNQEMSQELAVIPERRKKRKRPSFMKRITSLVMSALLFGTVAGGAFYGVGTLVNNEDLSATSSISSSETESSVSNSGITLTYTSATATESSSMNLEQVAAQGLESVVAVTNTTVTKVRNYFNQFGSRGHGGTQTVETTSCGSGVIFAEANDYLYMLTNYHVVEDATTLSVTFADDETYEAILCGYDEDVDIAVVKVAVVDMSSSTLSSIEIVEIADTEELNVGQQVVAIGNALGYGQSVTTGIVSALDRSLDSSSSVSYIQTDAAINPGNSGGALLDMNGSLIGINTAKVSSTEVEGMCYAIPISAVLDLIEDLMF